jgi:hypothetical protein
MANLFTTITAESAGTSPYEFDSITVEADNTFAPSTEQAYAGSYSYKAGFGGTSGSNSIDTYKTYTATSLAYVICRFRINDAMTMASASTLVPASLRGGTAARLYLRLSCSTGGVVILNRVYYSTDSGDANYVDLDGSTVSKDTWHTLILYYKTATAAGANNGEYSVKLDGTVLSSSTSLDNDTKTCSRFTCGNSGAGVPSSGSAIYFDNIEGYDAIPSGGASIVPLIMQSMNQFNGGMQ